MIGSRDTLDIPRELARSVALLLALLDDIPAPKELMLLQGERYNMDKPPSPSAS